MLVAVSIVSDTKSKTGTRTCIESPLALICPLRLGNHNVIDTCCTEIEMSGIVDIEACTSVDLKEVLSERVLITDLCTVSKASTDCSRLS